MDYILKALDESIANRKTHLESFLKDLEIHRSQVKKLEDLIAKVQADIKEFEIVKNYDRWGKYK